MEGSRHVAHLIHELHYPVSSPLSGEEVLRKGTNNDHRLVLAGATEIAEVICS